MNRVALELTVCVVVLTVGCSSKSSTPTAPTPVAVAPVAPAAPVAPTVSSVAVTGTSSFTEAGARAQLTARVTMSDGTTDDRTNTATWQSENTTVATVSSQGLVTVLASGDTSIVATVADVRGALPISVKIPNRTADPQ